MNTRHSSSALTILARGVLFATAIAGCSSKSDAPATAADTGVVPGGDTSATETSAITDTGVTPKDTTPTPTDTPAKPEVATISCAADLPSDFACATPKIPPGGTSCSEAMVQEFYSECFGTGSTTSCTAWQKKYAECSKCVFTFVSGNSVQIGYCTASLAPTSNCGKLQLCNTDCTAEVCADCDTTEGTGKTTATTEYQDCVKDAVFAGSASKPKGRCYDVAVKDFKAGSCASDASVVACNDIVPFFRGACRDKANWTNMNSAGPASDAGADTAVATETGVDAGTTAEAATD